jgi:hypothetical protein
MTETTTIINASSVFEKKLESTMRTYLQKAISTIPKAMSGIELLHYALFEMPKPSMTISYRAPEQQDDAASPADRQKFQQAFAKRCDRLLASFPDRATELAELQATLEQADNLANTYLQASLEENPIFYFSFNLDLLRAGLSGNPVDLETAKLQGFCMMLEIGLMRQAEHVSVAELFNSNVLKAYIEAVALCGFVLRVHVDNELIRGEFPDFVKTKYPEIIQVHEALVLMHQTLEAEFAKPSRLRLLLSKLNATRNTMQTS